MIRQDDARDARTFRQGDLEGIAFRLISNRANQRQARTAVISRRRQNERGTAPRLFMAGLRIEREPEKVSAFWHVTRRAHQFSLPTGPPQSVSR